MKLDYRFLPISFIAKWGGAITYLDMCQHNGNLLLVCANIHEKKITAVFMLDENHIIPENSIMSQIHHNAILDISTNGDRWEGDVAGNIPFGFGQLYNENDRLIYSGFMYGMHKICYGTSYYEDMEEMMIKYEGMYMQDEQFGRGSMYDRNGQLDYEGEWIDGHPRKYQISYIFMNMDLANLSSFTEEIVISDNCCNGHDWEVLDFRFLPSLISLVIGSNCFMYTTRVLLNDLLYLEEFTVRRQSFTPPEKSGFENHSGILEIMNCPKLTRISIDSYSFVYYDVFHMQDLPKLVELSVGGEDIRSFSFKNCRNFSICNFPSLEVITIGWFCLVNVVLVQFESMYEVIRGNSLCLMPIYILIHSFEVF